MICLATPRLLLRTWRSEDVPDLNTLLLDQSAPLGNLLPIVLPADQVDPAANVFAELERAWANNDYGIFALEALDGGRLLGLAGLLAGHTPDHALDLVWHIRSDLAAGSTHGTATNDEATAVAVEALAAVIDWGFGLLDIEAIEATVAVDDPAACGVAEAAGMVLTSRTIDPRTNAWSNRFAVTLASWNAEAL